MEARALKRAPFAGYKRYTQLLPGALDARILGFHFHFLLESRSWYHGSSILQADATPLLATMEPKTNSTGSSGKPKHIPIEIHENIIDMLYSDTYTEQLKLP